MRKWDRDVLLEDVASGLRATYERSKKKTVPLPLEIVFRPDIRGTYNPRKVIKEEEIVYFEFAPGDGGDEPVEDAWEMREGFLKSGLQAVPLDGITLTFGRFGVGLEDISVSSDKLGASPDVWKTMQLLADEYLEWQSLIRAAMTAKMSAWPNLNRKFPAHKVDLLCQPVRLAVEWDDGRPVGIIQCSGILQALIATLQIDALMDSEYRFCACVGCPRSFKVKRKDQRYCGEECKHRQVVRDGRERQRKAAQQSKSRHPERKSK